MDVHKIVVALVIIIVIGWWVLSGYTFVQPSPARPDANFDRLINKFNSYPTELWFRNNSCVFDKKLKCSDFRFVVLESDGSVVYDSQPRPCGRDYLRAKDIPRTVEYQRASVTLLGVVLRGRTANLCEGVKIGSRYRLVHVSEYLFGPSDPQY